MLYLLQVYALVAAAVLLPLFLLYLVAAVSRLGLSMVRFMIRNLRNVSPVRTGFLKEQRSMIHAMAQRSKS